MSDDLDVLQGSWSVSALEMDGQAVPSGMLAEARVVIEGSRFTSLGMGPVYEGTLTLNPSANPPQFDLAFDAGPEKGNTNYGIYHLDGDSWRLALATRGAVRPAGFVSPAGSGIAVETLLRTKNQKRKKSAPIPPPSGPTTEFEGEWRMVLGVMNGAAMDEASMQWVKRTTSGNQTTVMAGPQTMLKVEFTYDASQSPPAIDYVGLAGANKGKVQLGIYKRDGDVLTFCIAPPGAARPTEFSSVKGDQRTLSSWKR